VRIASPCLIGKDRDTGAPASRWSGPLEVYPMGRKEASGVREAFRGDRREPRILCWNCKRLTPFQEYRCTNCGAKFAGGTGGVYSTSRPPARPGRSDREEIADAKRTLLQLFEDLQRVHDVAPRPAPQKEDEGSLSLFQCPSCGRFVAEEATSCLCGVKFAPLDLDCPECGSHIPGTAEICPVCHVRLAQDSDVVYECPRCGAQVDAEATRCACGVRFED